jgi:hypothetical protein
MMTKWMRIAALAFIPMLAACNEDATGPGEDPGDDVQTIRLTLGTQTVDVSRTGSVGGTFEIPRGQSTLTASFLRENGTPLSLPLTGGFQINLTPSNAARVTVTRVSAYVFTLNGVQTGAVALGVELIHGSHTELGPFTVNATVDPATDN